MTVSGWLRVAALGFGLLPSVALADSSEWVRNDQGAVRLVSAATATGTGEAVRLGLQFDLQPGWKVYWRNAGDAGYPPQVEWSGDNVAGAEMAFPTPHRFEVLGLQSIGYADAVTYPVTLRLQRPGEAVSVTADVDYLTCSEICVPQRAVLTLDLPAGPAEPSAEAHELNRWIAAVPGPGHGIAVARASAAGEGDGAVLRVEVTAEPPLRKPDLFVESADNIQFAPPKVRLSDGGRRAVFEAKVVPGTGAGGLVGKPLTVTVGEDARGVEAAVTPVAGMVPVDEPGGDILTMAALALLGGLILNLMPCVLPVLSLKVLGLIGHGGGERRQIRLSFVASSAGIVASFLALAAAAVAVKSAGMAVGWGIQFQQPLFLVALTVVVTLFAANLWGLFEVPMPSWLSGVGAGHGNPHSLPGAFLTGAFATLLATPCTAPFLGTAVGFALGHGPVEIVAIFAALGLGMALPYLAVAAFPGLAHRLPRPGAWMVTVKKVMGVALAATGLWLLSVLAAQTGLGAAGSVAGLMVGLVAVLAVRLRQRGSFARAAAAAAVVVLAGAAFVPPLQATSTDLRQAAKGDTDWMVFERDAILRLVAEGKTVFVDVTADWCITCQVNKAAVINRGRVAEMLAADGVVPMRADWTNPDDRIADYLASYGRYGIPFNAVYGPGAPEGIVLPELLTERVVVEALERAKGPAAQASAGG